MSSFNRMMTDTQLKTALDTATVGDVRTAIKAGEITPQRLDALMWPGWFESMHKRGGQEPAIEPLNFTGMDGVLSAPAEPAPDTGDLLAAVNRTNALLEAVLKELKRKGGRS